MPNRNPSRRLSPRLSYMQIEARLKQLGWTLNAGDETLAR